MLSAETNIITGAFGYTGKYICCKLLSAGEKVITLTNHPQRDNPFGGQVPTAPLNFANPAELVNAMQGAATLYNTYWIRFAHGGITFDRAVRNSLVLINAAREAGVRRIVHISITNALESSPLPYFKGKGRLEKAIKESGLSYAIIRPTVIFGPEDILINNIAWLLRKYPFFAIPGSGNYKLQPIFVEDLAELAVKVGHSEENLVIDAVGPDIFIFDDMVRLIKRRIGSKAGIVHLNPGLAYFLSKMAGFLVQDVILTRDEIKGLASNLLISDKHPTGRTSLSHWLEQNKNLVGSGYASEIKRHYK